MPTWKYQSLLPSGVPVFGIIDADDAAALERHFVSRGMTLVTASELTINEALKSEAEELPRIVQLRIGERLREALLTDLPAHEAIRAIAYEPIEHPVLILMPWMLGVAGFAAIVLLGLAVVTPANATMLASWATAIVLLTFLTWRWSYGPLVRRPRQLLLRIAERIEQGHSEDMLGSGFLPDEMRCVLDSKLDSRTRAASVAELVPELTGMRLQAHRFAASLLSPLIAMAVLATTIHLLLLVIVPEFSSIFAGFGISVPVLTQSVMFLADIVSVPGMSGFVILSASMIALLVLIYWLLITPQNVERFEWIPGLGISIRWQIQARVARILSVLLRNSAPPDAAIDVAARASGYPSVVAEGQIVAAKLRTSELAGPTVRRLSGLPLSLLMQSSATTEERSEAQRQQTAHAFQSYASTLEQASSGNSSMIAVIVETLVIVSASLFVGYVVIALFMPLIKLLNDLACVVFPTGVRA